MYDFGTVPLSSPASGHAFVFVWIGFALVASGMGLKCRGSGLYPSVPSPASENASFFVCNGSRVPPGPSVVSRVHPIASRRCLLCGVFLCLWVFFSIAGGVYFALRQSSPIFRCIFATKYQYVFDFCFCVSALFILEYYGTPAICHRWESKQHNETFDVAISPFYQRGALCAFTNHPNNDANCESSIPYPLLQRATIFL